jgi:glycerophosphoryl diester phosphodiesterase
MNLNAHRGNHTHAPENSMLAFHAVAGTGATGFEFDVRLTANHVPVVFHHMRFSSPNLPGFIADYTDVQLQAVELICPRTQQPYHIPTLRDVLETFADQCYLEIHVLDYAPEVVSQIANILSDYASAWHAMEIISYEPAILLGFQRVCAGIATDLLFRAEAWMTPEIVLRIMADKARLAQARGVHLFPQEITPEAIRFFDSQGLTVHCGVVDDVDTLQRLRTLGIGQACSNDVEALLKGQGRKNPTSKSHFHHE